MYQRSYSVINRRRALVDDQPLVKCINTFQLGSKLVRQFIFNLQLLFLKCNVTCFLRTWRHFPCIISPYFFKKKIIFVTESIFYKFYYFPKFPFLAQNVFLLSILQHVIASQSNHINTMLPNEVVLAPQQKLKTLHFKCCGLKKYGKMKCLMMSGTRKQVTLQVIFVLQSFNMFI
jgi:hypothetical protein